LGAIRSGIQSLLRGADQDQQLMRELVKGMDDEADRMQHVLDELAHLHDEVIGTLELEKEFLILDQWLPKVLLPWKQSADEKGSIGTKNILIHQFKSLWIQSGWDR
jgi:signal transduction histidine kinase